MEYENLARSWGVWRLCLILVVSGAAEKAGGETSLHIVTDGRSTYEILVAPAAFPITVRAARELRDYIARATGATLPIRRGDAPGDGPTVVVGPGPAARAGGVDLDNVPPEGFRIKTVGHNLYIVGRDTAGSADSLHWRFAPQSGTWYGVSRFLESQLGIRWFFPGDLGEVVPKRASLIVPSMDLRDAPKMVYRAMHYLWDRHTPPKRRREALEWLRRNGAGWSIVWRASHSWIRWFKGETYFKEHPDWFALVNGRRLGYASQGLQMCTTNPEALDEFARVIIENGKKNPGVMFSLSPNDGGNHCECARCRALDVEKFPDGSPVLTDRYVTYCNEIVRRVCKVLPDQTFGFYAYSFYALPPRHTRLDPRVHVMEVMNDIGLTYTVERVRREHLEDRLLPWKRQVGRLFFYSHPEGMGNLDLPSMHFEVIRDLYHDLRKAGVTGFSMNNAASFAATGLNNYLYLRMAWDPGQDADKLYSEALVRCYGHAAAPEIRSYFEMVERRMREYAVRAAAPYNRSTGSITRFPGELEQVYPGLYGEGMPRLRKALSLARSEGQRARIRLLVDCLDYTRMTVQLFRLSKKVVGAAEPAVDDILAALKLSRARRRWMEERDQTDFGTVAYKLSAEKTYRLPFDPAIYQYLLDSARGIRKQVVAPGALTPPVIDGRLDDDVWKRAPELVVNLDKDTGRPRRVAAAVRIYYTRDNLYLGIRCDEPLLPRVRDSIIRHDGKVWSENDLEIFFDVNNAAQDYHQICINTLGTLFDKSILGGKEVEWESKATVAVGRTPTAWFAEIAVPFAALAPALPEPGDVWGFNVCRVRTVAKPTEYTCWSPTFGGFHAPKRFGKLIFGGGFVRSREEDHGASEAFEKTETVPLRTPVDPARAKMPASPGPPPSTEVLDRLRRALTYYQPCESFKATLPGENVHPQPLLFPGRFGRAFRMEQRWALNRLRDPLFEHAPGGAWIAVGRPRRIEQEGPDDSATVGVTRTAYLRQVVTGLKPGQVHCLSVHARSPRGGRLQLAVKSGAVRRRGTAGVDANDWRRFYLSFTSGATTATVTLRGADDREVWVAGAQCEAGKSWPRALLPKTAKPGPCEWVDIPARPEVFNPMKGAVAFWCLPEWLDETAAGGMGFFRAEVPQPGVRYAKKTNFISIGAYRYPGRKGWENGFNLYFRDCNGRGVTFVPVCFDDVRLPRGQWTHLVFSWEIVPGGDSRCTAWLNGRKAGEKVMHLGAVMPPASITMGYSGGAYADGLLDEFCIFDRPLTDEEAAALFRSNHPLGVR
ncbi:MAG: DUF4838 domain-containing protein [Kiritimatiellaeota bacterium]|nr:DUF4838 domain-containing protein [Kiritimatiellota bacterium]